MNTEMCTWPVSSIQWRRCKTTRVCQFHHFQLLISKEMSMQLPPERPYAGTPGEKSLPAGLPGGTWGWGPQHQAPSASTARRKSNSWIASGSRWGWECHSKTLGYKLLLEGKKRKKKDESKRVGSRETKNYKEMWWEWKSSTHPAYRPASNTVDTFIVALTCHYFLWFTPAFTA